MPHSPSSPDKLFIPFNFSAVSPFDPLACAVNQLPTLHPTEPDGPLSAASPAPDPTAAPTQAHQADMCRLMLATVQDEEWKRDISTDLQHIATSAPSDEHAAPSWLFPFCHFLASNIQHSMKRPNPITPSPLRRSTPKRPRPAPMDTTPAHRNPRRDDDDDDDDHVSDDGQDHDYSPGQTSTPARASRSRNNVPHTPQQSHSQELKRQEHVKVVDSEKFANFLYTLKSFAKRPDDFAAPARHRDRDHNDDDHDDPQLLATASLSDVRDLHQAVRLVSSHRFVGHVPPDLLTRVLAVLRVRVRRAIKQISAFDQRDGSSQNGSVMRETMLGVVAATTILSIISAPAAPRVLLVQEMLEDLAQLFRSVANSIIFPVNDPMFRGASAAKGSTRKKSRRGSRKDQEVYDPSVSDDDDDEQDYSGGRSSGRSGLKKDEALSRYFSTLIESFTSLFSRESHLPDEFVDTCAVVCIQSISVTGIMRLQSQTIKLVAMIFFCYPSRRLYILDEARESIKSLPAARKDLRTYQLSEDRFSIRPSSALLCLLLTIGSNDREEEQALGALTEENFQPWKDLRLKRYRRATKLALHVLEPLFDKVCADRDAESRAAFQSFFEDLLTLYCRPEWPSAELMLQTLSVSIITKLRTGEEKSVLARVIAIETLGAIASKICQIHGDYLMGTDQPSSSQNVDIEKLEVERVKVLSFLARKESLQMDSAHSFLESLFLHDDFNVASACQKGERSPICTRAQDDAAPNEGALKTMMLNAISRSEEVQAMRDTDIRRVDAVAALQYVGAHRNFASAFKTIISAICEGMHDPAPTIRAKSIKALSTVDSSCPGLLQSFPTVLPFIESSCWDVSILARDAALELLSRSLIVEMSAENGDTKAKTAARSQPSTDHSVVDKIFDIVMKRMCDTATSVRKRAIGISRTVLSESLKFLRRNTSGPVEEFGSTPRKYRHENRIIRICAGLVHRLDDPETSVKELSERVLRFGLFGYDPTNHATWSRGEESDDAPQLARRLTHLYVTLPSNIHLSFMSRVVHKAMLIKERPLLTSIISAAVVELHGYEARISEMCPLKDSKRTVEEVRQIRELSLKRVGCSSVICALGSLDASLIEPHCKSLAPSIKGVIDGSISESDLLGVQRILNVLEIGIGKSNTTDSSLIDEVIKDVELIVCQSPTVVLEEASAKCFCVVARKAKDKDAVERSASAFQEFLDKEVGHVAEVYQQDDAQAVFTFERHARCALVRLGLLARYGSLSKEFTEDVYKTLIAFSKSVRCADNRGKLSKAAVRALSHFLIGHRAFLQDGTNTFLEFLEKHEGGDPGKPVTDFNATSSATPRRQELSVADGVKLCILQGFHELLRDEEERNTSSEDGGAIDEVTDSVKILHGEKSRTKENGSIDDPNADENRKEQPVLAAEEDAEAGFLALSAQALFPHVKEGARNPVISVRRTVANIVALLVRQGLLLPANVVPCLFSLLLDHDALCREFSMRVVSFIADRHSGMLTSATVPALRTCFKDAYSVQFSNGMAEELTRQRIQAVSIDARNGQSLLSGALMSLRREQRRGVLENMLREFDPRVVVIENAKGEETQLGDEEQNGTSNGVGESTDVLNLGDGVCVVGKDEDDDDDMGISGLANMDLSECDSGGRKQCSLATLHFFAMTLACIDYTNGAGVGGSLTQGGGTAAAETRMKLAKEDVTELVGIATRIISNSGQAILRLSKHMLKKGRSITAAKKAKVVTLASRMNVLLSLKHHLKVRRWKAMTQEAVGVEEDMENGNGADGSAAGSEGESLSGVNRMPEFEVDMEILPVIGWGQLDVDQLGEECIERQLSLFVKLMNNDAIDEGDVAVAPRRKSTNSSRTPRSGRGRNAVNTPSAVQSQGKVNSNGRVSAVEASGPSSSLRKKRKRSYRYVVDEDDDDDDDDECDEDYRQ